MKVRDLKEKLIEQFTQLDTLLFTITDMGEAAVKAGDTTLQHALEETHWSVVQARSDIIVALSCINALTKGESK